MNKDSFQPKGVSPMGMKVAFPGWMKISFASFAAIAAISATASADVVVTLAGGNPDGASVKIKQTSSTSRSVTSMRNKSNRAVANGVQEQNRDFGQTFTTGEDSFYLDRITLKTGTQPIAPSVFGAAVSVQLMEVSGTAVVNDNGTKTGKVAPWCDDPRVDDFIEGEQYTTLSVARGALLPAFIMPGNHIVLNFRNGDRHKLKPNTQYAFLIMFDEPAEDRSLSFVTSYWSEYAGGHAIRREGELSSDIAQRTGTQPTTKAGTKSDVFSDAVFWVEGSNSASGENAVAKVENTDANATTLPLPNR